MMETFIVLGLCFILYEALDFFQGCMHSTQPATSDRIESYRRQITEEKLRSLQSTSTPSSASASPIINAVAATPGNVIENSPKSTRLQHFPESCVDQRYHTSGYHQHQSTVSSSTASLPQQQPPNSTVHSANNSTNFSSLPRDYYYLQQQKHKHSTKFLSKFSSSLSDNRIFPEVFNTPVVSVGIASSPTATFDIVPPTAAAAPLVLDLKRAIFSGKKSTSHKEQRRSELHSDNGEYLSSSDDGDDDGDYVDEDESSCSSDNDELVKRIYSISEKF